MTVDTEFDLQSFVQKVEQLLYRRRFADCLHASERSLELLPGDARFALLCCMSLYGMGRKDQADIFLKELVSVHGNDLTFLNTAGEYSLYCNVPEISLYLYDRAIAVFPDAVHNPDYAMLYRTALEKTGAMPFPLARQARFYGLYEHVLQTNHLRGAIAECGCFRGLSTYIIAAVSERAVGRQDNQVWVFDSFQGLSEPTAEDAIDDSLPDALRLREMTHAGSFAAPYEDVKRNLSEFPHVNLVKGWIPNGFAHAPEQPYRFVSLDVDLYQPTLDSLRYFVPRLVRRGILICDDYNWPGARKAIEQFLEEQAPESLEIGLNVHGQLTLRKL